MNLHDIVSRVPDPEPWSEGEKIPWNEPEFSRRMLAEHLSQDHDLASRRTETIGQHVSWIHHRLLGGEPSRVLDLCCGPGLYCSRLAALGHTCVGIDFGPASIEYARARSAETGEACTYVEADVRQAVLGTGFDLAMLIFGELNVFRPEEARAIVHSAADAIAPGGWLVMEPQTPEAVQAGGEAGRTWSSHSHGLFSPDPHLWLEECTWNADRGVATTRYFIVDTATGTVTRHAASVQAYRPSDLAELVAECGFEDVRVVQAPGDAELAVMDGLMWLVARRRGA